MIAPELMSNDELERAAYQQNDPLLRAMADRLCDHREEDIADIANTRDLENAADEAEAKAEELAELCVEAAKALRATDERFKYQDLIKKVGGRMSAGDIAVIGFQVVIRTKAKDKKTGQEVESNKLLGRRYHVKGAAITSRTPRTTGGYVCASR